MAALLCAGAVAWARSAHRSTEAMQVASAFLRHLDAGQFPQAFDLTVKQGYVGRSAEALQAVSARERCRANRFISTFPFQSNGNRLHRRLTGREVEMPEVHVEFAGDCLMGVALRHTRADGWRVVRFASHAG